MKQPEQFYKMTAAGFRRLADAEVYSFSFVSARGHKHGWAFVFLHEASGTVSIHSDYGDWLYSWPSPGRGPGTLKEFVCHGSYDYMACKFEMGRGEVFDGEATKKVIIQRLLRQRRDNELDKEKARNLYGEIENCDWHGSVEAYYLSMDEDLKKWLGGEWYEFNIFDREHRFYWLRDGVLPALVTELRKTLTAAEAAP